MLVLLVAPFFVGAGFLLAKFQHTRVKNAWTAAARQLGLKPTIGGLLSKPQMGGTIGDVEVLVDVYTTGSNNKSSYTRYRVAHAPVGPPVRLSRQGTLSFMRKWVGGRDVEIGDAHFDKNVIVDASRPDQVAAFLTPSRRVAVLDIFESFRRAEITHSWISVETNKVETNELRLISTVHRLVDAAAVMGAPGAVDAALAKREQGHLAESAAEMHEINRGAANSFTQLLEAEALVELGDHQGAREVLGQVGSALSGDSTFEGWKSLADLPPPPLPAPPPPVPPPVEAPERTEPSLAMQPTMDELFDAGLLSFELVEHFEKKFAGRRVTWEGEVTNFSRYRHDNDFGAGPGTKVTLLLGTSGRADLLSNQVHAVVQMDASIDVERGMKLAFEGVLARVD